MDASCEPRIKIENIPAIDKIDKRYTCVAGIGLVVFAVRMPKMKLHLREQL